MSLAFEIDNVVHRRVGIRARMEIDLDHRSTGHRPRFLVFDAARQRECPLDARGDTLFHFTGWQARIGEIADDHRFFEVGEDVDRKERHDPPDPTGKGPNVRATTA